MPLLAALRVQVVAPLLVEQVLLRAAVMLAGGVVTVGAGPVTSRVLSCQSKSVTAMSASRQYDK
jgi:hypothetical protein